LTEASVNRRTIVVWGRNLVVIAIVVAFVAFFGQPGGSPTTAPVAEVEGESISRETFEFFRAQSEARLQQIAQDQVDPRTLQELLDRQTLDALIQRQIMSTEASALGLRVSEPEVRAEVLADRNFRRDGRFDRELFERFVVHSGIDNPRDYTAEVGRDLLLQKFQRVMSSPIRVSRAAAEDAIRRAATRIQVAVAVARPKKFEDAVELTNEEVAAYAQENRERVEQAYQGRIDEYKRPEEIRVRHILLTGPDAEALAEKTLQRAGAGEDFAALAGELSDDAATKEEGGDLGFFPRGRMLPPFEDAAFALQPGELSQPVTTERGVHVIRLEERREAVERSIEEVTPDLARALLREERGRDAAREAADRMAGLLQESRDFEEAAAAAGLELEKPGSFAWTDPQIPGIGGTPAMRAAAFSLRPGSPSSPKVFEIPSGYALISLLDRQGPAPEELGADLGAAREGLEQELRGRVLSGWYEKRREELQRSGALRLFSLYRGG
jgi:peptidyl-prolyl cis-trans isomerase D